MIMGAGYHKNVAQKLPKIRREEELSSPDREAEPQWPKEIPVERRVLEKEPEKKVVFPAPKAELGREKPLDVRNLIEDLHAQLLVSNQTKRALETDLASSQKTAQQLARDNRELRNQFEDLKKELQKLKEAQAETAYLREENSDALEKIKSLQQELRTTEETSTKVTEERDEALNRALELESQMEQTEVLRIKGKLREREASHFAEENRELRSRLEELQLQNMEIEKDYEEMRRSFNEVKESLTFLRDSCKAQYYNLSDNPE